MMTKEGVVVENKTPCCLGNKPCTCKQVDGECQASSKSASEESVNKTTSLKDLGKQF